MKTSILLIINFLCIGTLLAVDKGGYKDSKTYSKTVPASKDFELEINNKHGNIEFEAWSKDSVSVVVNVEVESSKSERLTAMLSQISINFTTLNDYLAIETQWKQAGNGIKNDVLKLLGEHSIQVNYTVKAPIDIAMQIENKYGDIEMENFNGKLKLDISHGNVTARTIKNLRNLKLKYGKLRAKEITNGSIYARFSKLRIATIDNLNLNCASSEIEIETANKIDLKSLSDEIEIEKINRIELKSTFSDIEIENLTSSINGYLKHGSLEIEKVSNSVTKIGLNGQSTNIDLNFTQAAAFEYFVQLDRGKSFSIPSSGNQLNNENTFDNIHQYEGTFSIEKKTEFNSKIRIMAKNSYIVFDVL